MNHKDDTGVKCTDAFCDGYLVRGDIPGDLHCNKCGDEYFVIRKETLVSLQNELQLIKEKAKKLLMAFPSTVEGDGKFNIPAYIIEELRRRIKRKK